MYEVLIKGFNTPEEAKAFIHWYSGQGEQDAAVWFQCRKEDGDIDTDFMPVDCTNTFPVKFDGNRAKMVVKPV